jgi:hypothetical protein
LQKEATLFKKLPCEGLIEEDKRAVTRLYFSFSLLNNIQKFSKFGARNKSGITGAILLRKSAVAKRLGLFSSAVN